MSEELKPCRWCGHTYLDHVFYNEGRTVSIYCNNCGADGPSAESIEEAERLWNTRAPDTAQAELLREAGEVITDFVTGGCYVCGGDCASANPPVASCPMALARDTLALREAPAPDPLGEAARRDIWAVDGLMANILFEAQMLPEGVTLHNIRYYAETAREWLQRHIDDDAPEWDPVSEAARVLLRTMVENRPAFDKMVEAAEETHALGYMSFNVVVGNALRALSGEGEQ